MSDQDEKQLLIASDITQRTLTKIDSKTNFKSISCVFGFTLGYGLFAYKTIRGFKFLLNTTSYFGPVVIHIIVYALVMQFIYRKIVLNEKLLFSQFLERKDCKRISYSKFWGLSQDAFTRIKLKNLVAMINFLSGEQSMFVICKRGTVTSRNENDGMVSHYGQVNSAIKELNTNKYGLEYYLMEERVTDLPIYRTLEGLLLESDNDDFNNYMNTLIKSIKDTANNYSNIDMDVFEIVAYNRDQRRELAKTTENFSAKLRNSLYREIQIMDKRDYIKFVSDYMELDFITEDLLTGGANAKKVSLGKTKLIKIIKNGIINTVAESYNGDNKVSQYRLQKHVINSKPRNYTKEDNTVHECIDLNEGHKYRHSFKSKETKTIG